MTEFEYFEGLSGGSDRFASFLPVKPQKLSVMSLAFSRLGSCNALLAGIPRKPVNRVQRVTDCAARLVRKAPRREHVIPLLVEMYWLPAERRK